MGRRTRHPTQAHFVRRQWETREEKSSGRRTPVNKGKQEGRWETTGDNGRQGETRPQEGGRTIQHRHTCGQTKGDKGGQDPGKVQAHMWGDNGRQDLGKGGHTITGLGKARQGETGRTHMWGDNGRQRNTRPREGKHTSQHMLEDNGRQGATIQHRHKRGETLRDNGRQDLGKADTPSNTGTHAGRMGEKGRQDLGNADTPTQAHVGRWKTRGDKAGRWTHHPPKQNKRGHMGRQDLGKVDTPSNTGTHMWRQGETRPRADIPSQAHIWGKTSGRRALRGNG